MIQIPDLINGTFEIVGGFLYWFNVVKLKHDKQVKGVYWPVSAFFTVWGMWNIIYYPLLDQWASFFGGLVLFSGNLTWVCLALYYIKQGKKHGKS